MRLVVRRVSGPLLALLLVVASMAPVTAQSSDSITVTGEVVAFPLSITLSDDTVTFGRIDHRATAQTGGTIYANGFLVSGNGAQWVSRTTFSVTVDSPNVWSATICATATPSAYSGLFRHMDAMPADAAAANAAFGSDPNYISGNCTIPTTWLQSQASGMRSFTRYLGVWVDKDAPFGTLNGTITITVSN